MCESSGSELGGLVIGACGMEVWGKRLGDGGAGEGLVEEEGRGPGVRGVSGKIDDGDSMNVVGERTFGRRWEGRELVDEPVVRSFGGRAWRWRRQYATKNTGQTCIRPRGMTKASPPGLVHCVFPVIVSATGELHQRTQAEPHTIVVASILPRRICQFPPLPLR